MHPLQPDLSVQCIIIVGVWAGGKCCPSLEAGSLIAFRIALFVRNLPAGLIAKMAAISNIDGIHMCCSAHGVVHAIVRAKSDEEAAARLRAGFDSGSAELLQTFDALSRDHLVVHTGALMLSRTLPLQTARATG